jgi:hypothetical protein
MTGEQRRLGVVRDYAGLIAVIRARVEALEVAWETVDTVAGLPLCYSTKLVNGGRGLGSISFGPLMQVLGLELVVQENLTGYERIRKRLEKRRWARKIPASGIRAIRSRRKRSPFRGCSDWGKLMRARQLVSQSPEQRSRMARYAIECRWRQSRQAAVQQQPDTSTTAAGE